MEEKEFLDFCRWNYLLVIDSLIFLKSIFNYNNGDTLSIQDLEKKIQGAYTLDYFKYIFYEVQKINKTEYNLIRQSITSKK